MRPRARLAESESSARVRGGVFAVLARPRGLEGVIDAGEIKGCPMSKWLDTIRGSSG